MVRSVMLLLVAGLLAGCAGVGTPPPRDAEECLRLFRQYDRVERRHGAVRLTDEGARAPSTDISRWAQRLVVAGCRTRGRDLDRMEAVAAGLTEFRIVEGPTAIRPVPVHLGVLTSIADEVRVTMVFRGLGYNSRGVGAIELGRRIYIGPFASQEAVDQALALAREVGFIAPYVPAHTRF